MNDGAAGVVIAATHAILSDPAVDRLKNCPALEVVVTNTLPIPAERQFDKLTVLSIAPLISRAIREVFEDGSVTSPVRRSRRSSARFARRRSYVARLWQLPRRGRCSRSVIDAVARPACWSHPAWPGARRVRSALDPRPAGPRTHEVDRISEEFHRMSESNIQAEPRTEFGKGAARRIRRADKVPAVLYGHGTDPVHITLPGHDTMLALKHGGANALLVARPRRQGAARAAQAGAARPDQGLPRAPRPDPRPQGREGHRRHPGPRRR